MGPGRLPLRLRLLCAAALALLMGMLATRPRLCHMTVVLCDAEGKGRGAPYLAVLEKKQCPLTNTVLTAESAIHTPA